MSEAVLMFAWMLAMVSPFWVPLVFAAYAVGRRKFGTEFLLALLTAEAIAIGLAVTLAPAAMRWLVGGPTPGQ